MRELSRGDVVQGVVKAIKPYGGKLRSNANHSANITNPPPRHLLTPAPFTNSSQHNRLLPHPAFVEIAGMSGLLHISQISYDRIEVCCPSATKCPQADFVEEL